MSRENKCFNCGSKFIPYHNNDLFCSKRCRLKYYKNMYMNVPKCSNCYNINCKYKQVYKGKYSPLECPERSNTE